MSMLFHEFSQSYTVMAIYGILFSMKFFSRVSMPDGLPRIKPDSSEENGGK